MMRFGLGVQRRHRVKRPRIQIYRFLLHHLQLAVLVMCRGFTLIVEFADMSPIVRFLHRHLGTKSCTHTLLLHHEVLSSWEFVRMHSCAYLTYRFSAAIATVL